MPKMPVLKPIKPVARAYIPVSIQLRINDLKAGVQVKNGVKVVKDFAIFIDTHRDQPHIGSFGKDIHRGYCRPTKVDYVVWDPASGSGDLLFNPETGVVLARHDKHLFVTEDWFANFLVEKLVRGEPDPRDGDGVMATSHLRDARAKVYQLKSFRQIVMDRWFHEKANKTSSRP